MGRLYGVCMREGIMLSLDCIEFEFKCVLFFFECLCVWLDSPRVLAAAKKRGVSRR